MTLIGYERNNFAVEGKEVTGFNIFLADEISPEAGKGLKIRACYLSDNKLEKLQTNLENLFEKQVDVNFNRYGKIVKISEKMLSLDKSKIV